jgi:hypothetical protein
LKSQITARQMVHLAELDQAQVATADGCRSLSEWSTARMDLHPDNAKNLVRTMRRTIDRPDLRDALASGEIAFDRMEALSRIPQVSDGWNIWMWPGSARKPPTGPGSAQRPNIGPPTTSTWSYSPPWTNRGGRCGGGFEGAFGALVDKTLTKLADDLPLIPDGTRGDSSWRKAMALVELATPMIRHHPSSPCSSTPPMPPNRTDE